MTCSARKCCLFAKMWKIKATFAYDFLIIVYGRLNFTLSLKISVVSKYICMFVQ